MCVRPKIRNREAQNETWGMPEETEETQGEPKGNVWGNKGKHVRNRH